MAPLVKVEALGRGVGGDQDQPFLRLEAIRGKTPVLARVPALSFLLGAVAADRKDSLEAGRAQRLHGGDLAVNVLGIDQHVRVRLLRADLPDGVHQGSELGVLRLRLRLLRQLGQLVQRLGDVDGSRQPRGAGSLLALQPGEELRQVLGFEDGAILFFLGGEGAEAFEAPLVLPESAEPLLAGFLLLGSLRDGSLVAFTYHGKRPAAGTSRGHRPLEQGDEREYLAVLPVVEGPA